MAVGVAPLASRIPVSLAGVYGFKHPNRPQIQACRAGSLQNGIERGVIVVAQPLVVITGASEGSLQIAL